MQVSASASIVHIVSEIDSLPLTSASFFKFCFLKNADIFNFLNEHTFNLMVFLHWWTMLQYYASMFLLKLFIKAPVDNLLKKYQTLR